jgi:hypothetical protein
VALGLRALRGRSGCGGRLRSDSSARDWTLPARLGVPRRVGALMGPRPVRVDLVRHGAAAKPPVPVACGCRLPRCGAVGGPGTADVPDHLAERRRPPARPHRRIDDRRLGAADELGDRPPEGVPARRRSAEPRHQPRLPDQRRRDREPGSLRRVAQAGTVDPAVARAARPGARWDGVLGQRLRVPDGHESIRLRQPDRHRVVRRLRPAPACGSSGSFDG